ncbi:MAG: hypothetical protein ACMG6S_20975 [Byssovorax sp.]
MISMRTLLGSAVLVLVVGACNYTVGECYPRGEADGSADVSVGVGPGGVGGSGSGATPEGGTGANACNAAPDSPSGEGTSTPAPPPNDYTELGTYVRCLGLDWITCESLCLDIGAQCSALAMNPQEPDFGVGRLKQCQVSYPGSTCTYCFNNGMNCTQIKGFGVSIRWWCTYTGGKGCE